MTLKKKMMQRMAELGIEPKRSLGQNFLISDGVVDKIIAASGASAFEETFEIGPGLGALTDSLREKTTSLRLIELDKVFAEHWRQQGLKVFEVDALRWPWEDLIKEPKRRLLISNLPYQISARIVVDFSMLYPVFSRMVLMFQKEVAQRIQADVATADYGLLTVVAQTAWRVSKVTEVGTVDFLPKPNVASRVLCFEHRSADEGPLSGQDYLNFLKLCFTNRRKMLLPKLTSFQSKDRLLALFSGLSLDEKARAENLSFQDYAALYRGLKTE